MLNRRTFKTALLTSVAAAAAIVGASAAQAQDTAETVVVTGSRIASSDALSAAPITVISSDQISQSKTVTLEQVLNRIPAMGQQGVNDQNSISPGGESFVDLRDLQPQRTLILIDGQRMVSTFVAGSQGQDLQNIPVEMVDHIDILRDGASPIYGADAIAGVINIITKKNFEGLELTGGAGVSTYGDHATKQLGVLFGAGTDKGGVEGSVQYFTEDPVRQSQRSWAKGIYAFSSAVPQGRFQDAVTGQLYCGSNTTHTLVAATSCGSFDTGEDPDLIQGRSVINANFYAHYDLADNLTLYSSSFFTDRKSYATLNPEPVGDVYPSAKWLSGIVIPASNPNNPTGHPLALRKRLYEVGDRIFDDNADTYQEHIGIKGKLWDGWTFDAGYQYGESDGNDFTHNSVNLTHIQELVGAQPCEVGAPAGCGGVTFAGTNSLTPAQAAYVRYVGSDTSRYYENIANVDVTGELPFLELPGGKIGVAIGADWRREAVNAIPDALKQTGDFAEGTSLPTEGQYSVTEWYGEIKLPVLKNVPFAESLTFDLAGRMSQYTNFGSAGTYKGGVDWAITDWVRFRGDYGTGIRAPQVGGELYLGANQSADGFDDPCVGATSSVVIANCRTAVGPTYNPATFTQAVPQLSAARVGNANLLPETSKSWNAGLVFTLDKFIPSLTVTADYYNIHVTNLITLIDPGTAVDLCYNAPAFANPYCSRFGARNSINGALTTYQEPYTNLGYEHTDGVDMAVTWASNDLPGMVGLNGWNLSLDGEATYVNNFIQQNLDGSTTQYAGQLNFAAVSTAFPKWKAFLTTTLTMPEGANFQVIERFVGQTTDGTPPAQAIGTGDIVPALLFTDININVPWKDYTFNLGIDNLLDKDPPLAADPYVQTVSNQYDFVGRFFYFKVTAKY